MAANSRVSRRHFIGSAAAFGGAAMVGLGCRSSTSGSGPRQPAFDAHKETAAPGPSGPPQYMLLVVAMGGFDSVMSTNPKNPEEVRDTIYCGYRGDQRIQGKLRLYGPLIGRLIGHDEELCLLRGVRYDTVGHISGYVETMRGGIRMRDSITDILGNALSGDAPLAALDLTDMGQHAFFLHRPRPKWADVRDEHFESQVKETFARRNESFLNQIANMRVVQKIIDGSARDPRSKNRFGSPLAQKLNLALEAIRGNWVKCVAISTPTTFFDSHEDNVAFQSERLPVVMDDVAALLEALREEENEHGSLLSQTTVVFMSELGRFPRLNVVQGKDHWPENDIVMIGKGVKGGVTIGATDRLHRSLPVDFRTGRPTEGGQPLYLDSAFATLLTIAGGDLERNNYKRSEIISAALA